MYRALILLFFLLISNSSIASINYGRPISVDSRIKTFIYSPNEVFAIVFSQGYYSYIEFAEGEKVKNIAVGDASSWKISHYDNKLLIMPFEASSRTNMIITTTKKRNYVFDLISTPNLDNRHLDANTEKLDNNTEKKIYQEYSSEKDISYVVRFYYPRADDEFDIDLDLDEVSASIQTNHLTDKMKIIVQENDRKYNYFYLDEDINFEILPIELFDDGCLTYFRFRDDIDKIPLIFIEEDKEKLPCKRLMLYNYIIIKGVHKKLFIHYENDKIEIINRFL